MRIFFDLNPEITSTIFLAGVGRSGTTWVEDVINARNDHRILFEPFHPYKVPLCRPFRYRQYIRPTDLNERYLSVARRILSGKVRNGWIDQQNKCFIARKRLIKDIRANLLLKWLHTQFPNVKIVLLMRHPCAVASSKLKSGWGTHLDEFLSQPELMTDHLEPFEEILRSAQTDFEKHIVSWCVENFVPLRQFGSGEVYVAFYENLCVNPESEFRAMFASLGLQLEPDYFNAFSRPSAMSRKTSAIKKGLSLVKTWENEISSSNIERATEILNLFGLSRIYGRDPMPLIKSGDIAPPLVGAAAR